MGDKPKGIKAYGGGFMACDAPQGNIPNPVTNAINCPAGYR